MTAIIEETNFNKGSPINYRIFYRVILTFTFPRQGIITANQLVTGKKTFKASILLAHCTIRTQGKSGHFNDEKFLTLQIKRNR